MNKQKTKTIEERMEELENNFCDIKKNIEAQKELSENNSKKLDRVLNLLTGSDDKKFNPNAVGLVEKVETMWGIYEKIFWLATVLGIGGGVVASVLADFIKSYIK